VPSDSPITKASRKILAGKLPVRSPSSPGRGGGRDAVAVGKDSLDWPKIFEAAKTGGFKNYFVEQNWDLTVRSVAYLKTLNV